MEEQFDNPTIVRFLEGRMPPEESAAFKARLAQDPSLALEVSFYETLLQRRDVLLKRRLREARQTPKGNGIWRYWGVLALILVGVFGAIWIRSDKTKRATFCNSERYNRLSPSDLLSTAAETDAAATWQAACDAYEQNNLTASLQKARSLTSEPLFADKANLLAGASAHENGQYEMALEFYNRIKPEAVAYRGRAQINAALAHHCLGQPEKGNTILSQLSNDPQMPPVTRRAAERLLVDLTGGGVSPK